MEGFWPIFYLMVILKIPVAALLYLVWWAIHQTPEPAEPQSGDDGHGFKRWRNEPKPPRGPRRGPHAPDARPLPPCPPGGRTRVLTPPAPVRTAPARARGGTEPARH